MTRSFDFCDFRFRSESVASTREVKVTEYLAVKTGVETRTIAGQAEKVKSAMPACSKKYLSQSLLAYLLTLARLEIRRAAPPIAVTIQ